MQNFIKELSSCLENNITNSSKMGKIDSNYNDLSSEDLTLYDNKIITKFRDKMLIERSNILQNYAENTKEQGEMFYIYATSTNDINSYNLYNCTLGESHKVITQQIENLPDGSKLGSVLRKQDNSFILDKSATEIVGRKINEMIQEKIEEQNQYLSTLRVDGHTYEVGEKHAGRIWLYDQNNAVSDGLEAIEEISFPKALYEVAKEGDLFVYENGEYHKK